MKKTVFSFALCLLVVSSFAEPLKVGDEVPAFAAKDQHGNNYEFKAGTRFLLIAFDMSTGKGANRILEKKSADFLETSKTIFVSNIHGMPAIGRAFALPKMRKYPHRILLADDEKLMDPFPKQKDRVTVLALDDRARVTRISFWDPDKEPIDEVLRSAAQ